MVWPEAERDRVVRGVGLGAGLWQMVRGMRFEDFPILKWLRRVWRPVLRAAAFAAVAGCAVGQGADLRTLPELREDREPLPPEVKARTSLAPVVKAAAPSVVTIYTTRILRGENFWHPFMDDPAFRRFFGERFRREIQPRERRARGLGSGVIVSRDGYILTNNHVIEQADEIRVRLADGRTEFEAEVVGADPHTDIAVLKVTATNLPAIVVADSDQLEVGDLVLALGNPFGVGQTVTMGIVSAVGRGELGLTDYEDFIQTDAPINVGNSGGALVDARGRLVGINTAIVSGGSGSVGIGFAVPINMARHVMERLLTEGRVRRGYLGIYLRPLTPDVGRTLKLPDGGGALVGGVASGTPAEAAGLREGDVIVEFNGRKVEDGRHLRLMASQTAPGTSVDLKVWREGRMRTVSLVLAELPSPESESRATGVSRAVGLLDGVELVPLDEQTRQERQIPDYIRGVLVRTVPEGSSLGRAGLRPGDVILQIQGRNVRTEEAARNAVRQAAESEVVLRIWRREEGQAGTRVLSVPNPRAGR